MGQWIIDGNNVFGSRPDGWWNDRPAAMTRFTQTVAEWCRTHDDDVTLVFDAPVPRTAVELAGGNLLVIEAPRRGRNAADDHIVDLARQLTGGITVVTSDRGLRERLDVAVKISGTGAFRVLIGY